MTEVSFHFNVPDRLAYTCRLLRKAARQGAQVVVTGPAAMLAQVDRALWTFDPVEFVPHLMPRPDVPLPERLVNTPVWLLEDAASAPRRDVLVNLGPDAPAGFESFARLVEIVSSDVADRAAARARWKHYAARGYAIVKHEVSV
ncbi:MAG: DNA polymerase III subunit chi [Burkholderiales bacterium]|nr:DNA polymerase III subunit chi [Burkholderiales bacterium]